MSSLHVVFHLILEYPKYARCYVIETLGYLSHAPSDEVTPCMKRKLPNSMLFRLLSGMRQHIQIYSSSYGHS